MFPTPLIRIFGCVVRLGTENYPQYEGQDLIHLISKLPAVVGVTIGPEMVVEFANDNLKELFSHPSRKSLLDLLPDRESEDQREEVKGAGVGLAVTKKIIELCGGRVWVKNTEEEGAIFYFTLPQE